MRVCVYTAVYGDYDELKPFPPQSVASDFVCFSDAAMPVTYGWRLIRSRRHAALHPRMRAKFFKLMSHRVFPHGRLAWRYNPIRASLALRPHYDALVWVDASLKIKSPHFVAELVETIGAHDWAMFVHPDRDCIYDEADLSVLLTKYRGLPIREQVETYRQEGYPAKAGLFACGIIARRSSSPKLAAVNEAWWAENCRWTYQDQLSLPVVLWRLGAGCDLVQHNLWNNDWFDCLPHRSEH